jgi:hypothetical protein
MTSQLSEAELKAQIQRLEVDARHIRRVIEHQPTEGDKRVLNRQLSDIRDQLEILQLRLNNR